MKTFRGLCVLACVSCLFCMSFTSCQKAVYDDVDTPVENKAGIPIKFIVSSFERMDARSMSFSRGTDVRSICSRLNLAVYNGTQKIKQINQLSTDSDFGTLQLTLPEGKYKIVVLAHNGAKNPTMTDIEKIGFNGKLTDTFYYCTNITVGSEAQSFDVDLKRAVAMVRFQTNKIPANVSKMKFYYTGGSSSLNALLGGGAVKSRQTEEIAVSTDMVGNPGSFDIFSIPRSDSNLLTMDVTAFDNENAQIFHKRIDGIQIKRNFITELNGSFFGNGDDGGGEIVNGQIKLNLFSNDEWQTIKMTY
ncbi:FimB/Mfa2 family fimbrial subunit [Hallella colorans]|uniref:Fimbrillin-A associated anchor protein Mfa1/Mfa2 n=1 Tax=Hallella colorans TaxID=1703337 RepID=A0A2U0U1I4_9BACT|nr:FimB/Mfa2 family fimbrial subunit [Hallella colorans]PVX50150.1 fimbrillin-A associated anchor protein Mfa1/Mfa2 [Hallella colorans]